MEAAAEEKLQLRFPARSSSLEISSGGSSHVGGGEIAPSNTTVMSATFDCQYLYSQYGVSWTTQKAKRMLQSIACCFLFAMVGWYFPRYLIQHETSLATKKPPYQQTMAGDVILDLTLNESVADPPLVSCESTLCLLVRYIL